MANKEKQGSFIMQAGILAAAGIICKIIGILYRSPLAHVIGDEGNGYYSSAYEIYTIILLVSSYSIPSAISKVIAHRLALGQYRNARKIFHCALMYVVVVGGAASILTLVFAGVLVGGNSVPVLRIFAPTIFFSGILGVLRGYFQAHGTMVPTSFSQILEQILNAVVSILAAFLLMRMVAGQDDTTLAIYGASGSAIGTGAGVLVALLFMLFVLALNRRALAKQERRDRSGELLETGEVYRIIITMVTPIILSTFIYNCNSSLNLTIYTRIMEYVKGMSEADAYTRYGLFSGKAKQISNIPIALASAMSTAVIPGVAGSFARKDIRETNRKIAAAVRTTMLLSIPFRCGACGAGKARGAAPLSPERVGGYGFQTAGRTEHQRGFLCHFHHIQRRSAGNRKGEPACDQCRRRACRADRRAGPSASVYGYGALQPGHRYCAVFLPDVHFERNFGEKRAGIPSGGGERPSASPSGHR